MLPLKDGAIFNSSILLYLSLQGDLVQVDLEQVDLEQVDLELGQDKDLTLASLQLDVLVLLEFPYKDEFNLSAPIYSLVHVLSTTCAPTWKACSSAWITLPTGDFLLMRFSASFLAFLLISVISPPI
jgi:hypothetical protein